MLFIIMAMDISIAVLPSNLRTWTFQEEEERFNLVFKTLNKLLVFVQTREKFLFWSVSNLKKSASSIVNYFCARALLKICSIKVCKILLYYDYVVK